MSEWEFSARTYVTFGEGDGKCGSGGDGAWPCCGSPGGQLGGLLSREEEKGGRGRVKRLRDIPTWFYLPILSVHWTPIGMFEDSDGAPYLMDRRSRKERPGVIGGRIALLLIHRFNHFNNRLFWRRWDRLLTALSNAEAVFGAPWEWWGPPRSMRAGPGSPGPSPWPGPLRGTRVRCSPGVATLKHFGLFQWVFWP